MKSLTRACAALLVFASTALADPAVYSAQQKLKRLGYYQGSVDGEYGSQTAAAIRRYQLAENLRVTGDLTPQTLSSLGITTTAPQQKPSKPAKPRPQATPAPAYVALADIFKGGPFISVGPELQIATIRQAQKNLRLLGYYGGPIDGAPSSNLVNALKAWQKSAGFRQTGRFDENTLKGLDIMPN
jgi:peptidoglycan hydrolase-like protein with peptidoglycan-binding domain